MVTVKVKWVAFQTQQDTTMKTTDCMGSQLYHLPVGGLRQMGHTFVFLPGLLQGVVNGLNYAEGLEWYAENTVLYLCYCHSRYNEFLEFLYR